MQVTLTPQNPKDSPMTFELEEGGSLSLGGLESDAQLSWDLLQGQFRTLLRRQETDIVIEAQEGSSVLINSQPILTSQVLRHGQIIQLGDLVCRVGIDSPNSTSSSDNDDDIFGVVTNTADHGVETSFSATSTVSVDSSRWLFKVLTGPNAGAQINLEDGKVYVIGSDAQSCDIVLTDLSVSKQHMKLTVFASGEMVIEDLKSRNGVLVNGEKIEEKSKQTSSAIVTAGATTFMVVDRTAEQKTIVTPSLPIKEKVIEKAVEKTSATASTEVPTNPAPTGTSIPASTSTVEKRSSRVLAGALLAFSLVVGLGIFSLFNEKVVIKEARPGQAQEIAAVLEEYPYFEYAFNESTGVLTLSGHILTVNDKRQLLSKLSQIDLIRRIDDTNLVVDEIVWQQFNMALEKNFGGINLSAISPGEFVLSGTLQNSSQAEALNRYLQGNFPYNDNLQNKVVVLDQLLSSINEKLQSIAPGELMAELQQGELLLVGAVPSMKAQDFRSFVEQIKNTPGIRTVRNLVTEQNSTDEGGLIDISTNYTVTGFSKASDANTSVMINGRILQRGDIIDGMTIVSIRPRAVILDRDGIKYRINYNP